MAASRSKNRLSQLVQEAQRSGPQVITVRGEEAAVVLPAEEYRRLTGGGRGSLIEYMRSSPWVDMELDLRRQDTGTPAQIYRGEAPLALAA